MGAIRQRGQAVMWQLHVWALQEAEAGPLGAFDDLISFQLAPGFLTEALRFAIRPMLLTERIENELRRTSVNAKRPPSKGTNASSYVHPGPSSTMTIAAYTLSAPESPQSDKREPSALPY